MKRSNHALRVLKRGSVALFLILPVCAAEKDAESIMKICRKAAAGQKADLSGRLRKDGIEDIPIKVFLREQNLQFKVDEDRLHMRIREEGASLFTVDGSGRLTPFSKDRLTQPIRGSDTTFEDLTMLFLYWPNPRLVGEDQIGGEKCYRLQIDNPSKDGAFQSVLLWVHQKFGVFWAMRGFDLNGRALKQFQVEEIMRIDREGDYGLKKMQVSVFDKEEKTKSITYLEFYDSESSTPKGLKR